MPTEPQVPGTPPASSAEQILYRPTALETPPEPPLFRFALRQLLWFVAVLSGILSAVVLLSGRAAAALLLASLIIAAHLFSTALASRLRSQTDEANAQRHLEAAIRQTAGARGDADRRASGAIAPLNRSPWHRRGSTSLPWLPRLIIAGILAGGIAGAVLLAATIGHPSSPAGILVGSASLGVVGGWSAFLCGSFYGIFRHGLGDALAEQQKDEARQRTSP